MSSLETLLPPDLPATLKALAERWHAHPEFKPAGEFVDDLIARLHRANFDLWHHEDRARDPRSSDIAIAGVKHCIDRVNQHRNDLVERLDTFLLESLAAADLPNASAPLHSETPGMMIDRISILALKIVHTAEEIERLDASEVHQENNRKRLAILLEQSQDLADCLVVLWSEVIGGQRRFKLYRQLKMYNDPDLNPVLYRGMPPSGA